MTSGGDIAFVIDMENSTNTAIENGYNVGDGKNLLYWECSDLVVCDRSIGGEEAVSFDNRLHHCAEARLENGETLVEDKMVVRNEKVERALQAEKPKKKGFTKPPRPPRPPRPLSLDLADQKLIKEITEIAMLKKARADRMKTLKKIKNGKSASASTGNTSALVITLIFCIVIFWQGIFPRGRSSLAFLGSPQSSIGTTTSSSSSSSSVISIQFYRSASTSTGSS